ncbi:MAG: pilin [Actinomycetota bacterium]
MNRLGSLAVTVVAADPGSEQILRVLDNLRALLVGLLVGLAVAALTYAGVRYVIAAGDPASVEKAKGAVKSAIVGLALALLAPVLVGIVKNIIGS